MAFVTQKAMRWLRWRQLNQTDRNILLFTLDTACQGLMMGGIFNFLSVFAVRLGATNLQTSLLTSLPSIVVALIGIPAGQIVQRQTNYVRYTNQARLWHRGFILLVALMPFVIKDSNAMITSLIIIWTVKAISNALMESSWMAVAAEILPPKRRAAINSFRWTTLSVVTAGAVFVYGLILDRIAFPLNYQIVFIISFLGGIAGMWFFGKMRVDVSYDNNQAIMRVNGFRKQAQAFVQSVRDARFVRYELGATVLRIALFLPSALYSIFWVRELGATDLWISRQGTASKIALIAGYILWGRVISRRGHRLALLICASGVALYPILMGFVPSQEWLPLIALLQGFFSTGIDLAFFDTLLAIIPEDRRPSFVSVNTSLAYFMAFIGPMLGNLLAEYMPIRTVFFIAGGFFLLSAVLFWRMNVTDD